jgi:hypothetical protein
MGTRRSRKDQAVATKSHVAGALLILATMDDLNRSWRSVDDISRIIQSVFEMPKTAEDKLSGALTVSDLSKDALRKSPLTSSQMTLDCSVPNFKEKAQMAKKRG